jgi:hypothetical protein
VKENVDNTASATSNQSNPEVFQIEESDGIKYAHSNLLDLVEYKFRNLIYSSYYGPLMVVL